MFLKKILPQLLIAAIFVMLILGAVYLSGGAVTWFEGALFWLLVLWVILFFRHYHLIYAIILFLSVAEISFFSYFRRRIESVDVKLFWTHMSESFETFFALPSLFFLPLLLLALGNVFLWAAGRWQLEPLYGYPRRKYAGLLFLLLLNVNGVLGIGSLNALFQAPFVSQQTYTPGKQIPLSPKRRTDISVVLLLGESMRYDADVAQRLETLGFFYRKVWSGATNTDVAVPLLLNGKNNPLDLRLDDEENLFRLAKKNGYGTHFISIQTEKALQYIKPYLQSNYIDHYRTYGKTERIPKYDTLLLGELKQIDFSRKQFVVMQQIGQHAPYRYYEGEKSDDIIENYRRSVATSFRLYAKIDAFLKLHAGKYLFIYVSDHGEFVGENGRYGHNTFDEMIYGVPMFISSGIPLPKGYETVASHYHLSQLLRYLLGYGDLLSLSRKDHIVNGTMLSREDGFVRLPYEDDNTSRASR